MTIKSENKLTFLTLLFLIVFFASAAQDVFSEVTKINNIDKNTDDALTRTGEISATELLSRYPKFAASYNSYEIGAEELKKFNQLDGFDLVVFLGLWCHDSEREVPRLLKLIKESNTLFKSTQLIAINPQKIMSEKYSSKFDVTNTPTIFVLRNNHVIAKIIEKPEVSLTDDLINQIFKRDNKH